MTTARKRRRPEAAKQHELLPDARAALPKRDRYPIRLALLPGQKWAGTLSVLGNWPEGFPVAFDAVVVDVVVLARPGTKAGRPKYVFDHAILSAEQLKAWTGVDAALLPPPFKR